MSKVLVRRRPPYTNGPAPHRPRGRIRALRRLQSVHADGGTRRAHGLGTDEHGTPILVLAEKEGLSAQEVTDKYNRVIATDLTDLGLSYDLFTRTTTANHYAVAQELFTGNWRNGYMIEQTTRGAISPSTGRTPRPLHRGHLPDLRLRRGARRPVRQLRQPARRRRADQPAQQDQRRDAGVRRDAALLPRPAGARGRAGGVARRAGVVGDVAAQRHQVRPQPARRRAAAGHDARHRLGHPDSPGGMGGEHPQAALRLVRRGRRLPVRVDRVGAPHRGAGAVARVVERPRGGLVLLPGQGQHHLPRADLAAELSATPGWGTRVAPRGRTAR